MFCTSEMPFRHTFWKRLSSFSRGWIIAKRPSRTVHCSMQLHRQCSLWYVKPSVSLAAARPEPRWRDARQARPRKASRSRGRAAFRKPRRLSMAPLGFCSILSSCSLVRNRRSSAGAGILAAAADALDSVPTPRRNRFLGAVYEASTGKALPTPPTPWLKPHFPESGH